MSPTICRTCLTVVRENSHEFCTLDNKIPGTATFREKLNCCIPELALDIIPDAVICTNCSTTLNLAYTFKTKCLEVETKVQKYLLNYNSNKETQWFADFKSLKSDSSKRICHTSKNTNSTVFLFNKNVDTSMHESVKNRFCAVKQEQGFIDASNSTVRNSDGIKSGVEYYDNNFNDKISGDYHIKRNDGDCSEINDTHIQTSAIYPFKNDAINANFIRKINSTKYSHQECKTSKEVLNITDDITNNEERLERTYIHLENDVNEEYGLINTKYKSVMVRDSFNDQTQQPQNYYNYFTKALQRLKDNSMSKSSSTYQHAFQHFNLLKVVQSLANQGTEINIKGLGISHKNGILSRTTNQLTKTSVQNFVIPTSDCYERLKNVSKQKRTIYERYSCYYCDHSFDRLSLLKTHIISHTGVKRFMCNICGKGCSHKGELNNHFRTHTGEKPFKCSLCEASFSQISNMKIHMRTHTGEKPYKCDYCEKKFSHKCGVKVHMRTHTGERPYKCDVCSKTYTHKKDLDDHVRTHTGEKYKCTICLKEITYKKNLSAHMITHNGKNATRLGVFKKNSTIKFPAKIT